MLEGILSLSLLALICLTLFPFMMNMLNQLDEAKKEVLALRLLYEFTESQIEAADPAIEVRRLHQTDFTLFMTEGRENRKACVEYEEREICVE